MTATRRTGLVLAAAATVLWLVVVAVFLTTAPEDDATVAAAMLALLATPVSLAASGYLLAAQRRRPGRAGEAGADAVAGSLPRRVARGLAVVSLVVLPAVWIVAPTDRLSPGGMRVLLFAGITAFVASSALFVHPRDRRG